MKLLGRAMAMLKRVEWVQDDVLGWYCPICKTWKDEGHKASCDLAAILSVKGDYELSEPCHLRDARTESSGHDAQDDHRAPSPETEPLQNRR